MDKDVDGFHLYNVGGLVVGNYIFPPVPPTGCSCSWKPRARPWPVKTWWWWGPPISLIKPMALMLLQKEATVTVCHAKTHNLAQHTILADILIVAAGQPGLIVPQMVKEGAVVIDVGINRLEDGRIVGDVDFHGVMEKASWITPVPGGVGPMTVTMLIENTLRSAERRQELAHGEGWEGWDSPPFPAGRPCRGRRKGGGGQGVSKGQRVEHPRSGATQPPLWTPGCGFSQFAGG